MNSFEQKQENIISGSAFSARLGRGFHTRPLSLFNFFFNYCMTQYMYLCKDYLKLVDNVGTDQTAHPHSLI